MHIPTYHSANCGIAVFITVNPGVYICFHISLDYQIKIANQRQRLSNKWIMMGMGGMQKIPTLNSATW